VVTQFYKEKSISNSMKIKEMPEDSRPRERLFKFGIENLSEAELLALILEKGTKKENAIELSSNLINKYGLSKLSERSLEELQEIEGIGFAKACKIQALFELNKRYLRCKNPITTLSSAKQVFDFMHEKLKNEKQESFIVLLLNNRNHFIKEETITRGILNAAIIEPREIFKSAIRNSAARIILVHNHPSGNSNPSEEDLLVSERITDVGELVGIPVLDHIIIGNGDYWSRKDDISFQKNMDKALRKSLKE
jgi:DNA repair protein RadC